jgi:D-amino-acid dehydrogenase
MAKHVDVLVIGGGSIGVCCAYFLAQQGRQVTVIDQGQIGGACSYANAGLLARSHIIPLPAPGVLLNGIKWMFNPESPLYIKPRLNLALLSWVARFALACRTPPMRKGMSLLNDLIQASMALHDELASLGGSEFCFNHKGSLAIYRSSKGFEAGLKQAAMLGPYGIKSKVLDRAEVRKVLPRVQQRIVGGIFMNDDAHLNPAQFVNWLASKAVSMGVTFSTSTEVLGFKQSGKTISTVQTNRGEFVADQVVLAAGSWSPGIMGKLGVTLPIQPAKGYSITVKTPEPALPIPIWLTESKVTVTPMGGILRFAGTLELAGLNFSINQRRVDAIRRAVREYLVGMDEYETLEVWRGLRPLTPDGLPIIATSKTWSNLIIATGHGMQGISLGPITGKLVAQLAAKETPSVNLAGLGEERFR